MPTYVFTLRGEWTAGPDTVKMEYMELPSIKDARAYAIKMLKSDLGKRTPRASVSVNQRVTSRTSLGHTNNPYAVKYLGDVIRYNSAEKRVAYRWLTYSHLARKMYNGVLLNSDGSTGRK